MLMINTFNVRKNEVMNYFSSSIEQLTILPLQILFPHQMFLKRVIYNWLLGEISSNNNAFLFLLGFKVFPLDVCDKIILIRNPTRKKVNVTQERYHTTEFIKVLTIAQSHLLSILSDELMLGSDSRPTHSKFTYPYSKWKLISKLLCSTINSSKISTMIV